jgi:SOS-response transcriptional repressors (RecA-mediated autopeptidases)
MQGDYFRSTGAMKKSMPGSFHDDEEYDIDLNKELIDHKAATFVMRVRGDAMSGAGIHDGDIIIVDRSLKPVSGKVVIAQLNGEMLIRRLEKTFNKMRLLPDTPRLAPIEVDAACDSFSIWGVVTYTIHAV